MCWTLAISFGFGSLKCLNDSLDVLALKCLNVWDYGRGRHAGPEKGDAKARQILATCICSKIFKFPFMFSYL